jgi:hypothetical protein
MAGNKNSGRRKKLPPPAHETTTKEVDSKVEEKKVVDKDEDGDAAVQWKPYATDDPDAKAKFLARFNSVPTAKLPGKTNRGAKTKKLAVMVTSTDAASEMKCLVKFDVPPELSDEQVVWMKSYYNGVLEPFLNVRHSSEKLGGLVEESIDPELKTLASCWIIAPDPVCLNYADDKLKDEPVMIATFLLQDVFMWFPALMFGLDGYPRCRYCGVHDPKFVRIKDWLPARRVVCADRVVHLIGPRYQCTLCDNKTFNCFNADVLKRYPAHIRESFPFLLTWRKGICNSVVTNLYASRAYGQSVQNFRERIIEQHKLRYHIRELQYYALASTRWAYGGADGADVYVETPPRYPEWSTENGVKVSEKFINKVWEKTFRERSVLTDCNVEERLGITRQMYYSRRQQFIDGKCWRLDGSHKVPRLVVNRQRRDGDQLSSLHNERACDGVLTWFNEYEQVLLQVSLLSHSMEEAASRIKEMLTRRYLRQGFPLPEVVFTDCCCTDRNFILAIFRELSLNVRPSYEGKTAPLELPADACQVVVHYGCDDEALLAATRMFEEMDDQRELMQDRLVLGLDMQWNLPKQDTPSHVATVQISFVNGISYLFQLKVEKGEPWLPRSLRAIINDPTITKAGVRISADIKKLCNSHPSLEPVNIVDVAHMAVDNVPGASSSGLLQKKQLNSEASGSSDPGADRINI